MIFGNFLRDNILELNKNHKIETFSFNGSNIYFIENFYKNPRKLKNWILKHESEYHKKNEDGYNSIHFEDKRHLIYHPEMIKVSEYITNICNKFPQKNGGENQVITNFFKFNNCNFNDYKNNYWYPHKDSGYTAIIYFDDTNTNLYECLDFEEQNNFNLIPEHKCPWRPKQKWEKIATLHGKFNKLILFDGSKFFHGADISTDEYTKKYRMNQVIFFEN